MPAKAKGKGKSASGGAHTPAVNWEIPFSQLTVKEQVGAGGFGAVHLADWQGTAVAVKKLWSSESKEDVASLRTEVAVLSACRHPNIVLLMGACTKPPNLCMVTEYISGGNLRQLLNDESRVLSWKTRVKIALDTARGMVYLHNRKVIHRDMKSYNLLVDEHYNTKICDFGISRAMPTAARQKMTMNKGTDTFMAPEVVKGGSYNESADVFSYGLVLWELWTRELVDDIRDAMADDPMCSAIAPPDLDESLQALAATCTADDPKRRPDFTKITTMLSKIYDTLPDDAVPLAAGVAGAGIGDKAGAKFWGDRFGQDTEVTFSRMSGSISLVTDFPGERLPAMSTLMCTPSTTTVTKASFGAFLDWFGAWPQALQEAHDVINSGWFHGTTLTADEAAARLAGKPDGTFLVRASASKPGCFSIAVVSNGAVRHSLVDKVGARFTVDKKATYPSIKDFVEAYTWLLKTPLAPVKK